MSALPPITDVGQHIKVSIWLSVYEYALVYVLVYAAHAEHRRTGRW
jgi:hypothetical protein